MSKSILIVDDQKGVRRLLEELFRKEGFSVIAAVDGLEAIKKNIESNPDLILMDMKMPNMNGLEASEQILTNDKEKLIVMMTAYGEMEIVKEALEIGVKKCITKPFDIMELKDMVENLLVS
ncbi:Sporulation initiation phosphotransferase (Spo0F) [Candidatus Syntrophocurvum alkaliphilum]|uniref:Stage 0 sporulation protein A homolog n=1 Tax=Candidatus Syntrophocurvum alkaliphilum TaxID=2293317 RepID=A0A6I6DI01_9FIRM|nr:response regulator [Candidatus Syntrophocurvum alkaliphilum]QGU00703.1 Sporulation initiation phosphotransferase (Spo0F) [Candidatus Syntrophocurvum alkaliphilum]